MSRSIDSATQAALLLTNLYLVWFLRLDIASDPVYVCTALGSFTFPGGSGYDPPIVGFNFLGMGNVGSIDPITDDVSGSQTLNLVLPGVDITNDYLHQLVANGDLWQGRDAYLWVATFDNSANLVGKPIRVKKARMDKMPVSIDPNNGTGTITVQLESQGSYSQNALFTRYSDQQQIDPTDLSQIYTADLANKVPQIGSPISGVAANTQAALINRQQIIENQAFQR
jgi:hypothetical protein